MSIGEYDIAHKDSKTSRRQLLTGPLLLLYASFLALSACSGLKYVPEGQKLYTGSKVTIKAPEKLPNQSALQTELESVITPKPNASFLGLRPKLYFWGQGQGKKKGLGKFLADKFGEPPVLLKDVKIKTTSGLITNRLYNNGFFKGVVTNEVKTQDKTAQVNYTATTGKPYIIEKIFFPDRDTLIDKDIRATQPGTLLKVGDAYNLNTFTAERVRIDNDLKNSGYFYFNPDYILFQVDSTLNNKINVYLRVKASAPAKATRPYWLKRIRLNTSYVLTDTTTRQPMMYKKYEYYPDEKVFKAKAITNATFMYPDSLYRRKRRDQTISRLMSLNTFKFVEIRFLPSAAGDSAGRGRLDADVRMTQLKKKSLRADLQLVSKSNGFTGPGLNVSFRNRSALRGGEQLLVNLVASTETQSGNGNGALGLTSYELGINGQLIFPRLVVPHLPLLDIHLPNSDFQPRTTIGAGVRAVTRANYFTQNFFNLNYGYTFKTKITNEQEVRPIDITYVQFSPTDVFTAILNSPERSFLRSAFQQQFILASSYRYTYNQQVLEQRRQQIYFSGQVEGSGNLAQGIVSSSGAKKNDNGKYTIGGQEYSQYLKFDLEMREYYRISQNPTSGNRIVARLQAGIGTPYGNSDVLPYPKQYGIGGPNSVRAFAARGIGPGTYKPATGEQTLNSFYDQVGDIRLEGNIEYRQDLVPYLKGALFLDAGNIWLANPDPGRQTFGADGQPDGKNGQFRPSTFLKELAVGAGAGLRVDVQFFVLRFDYAFPLSTPTGPPDNQTGRFNLAIGYPF
ncbi:translocation and assembly module lipoprotein TamL [Hymenobacter convexus]|uniref:translocation and assembly module lipoprotein TamL n=1 Tax=Hymenobacter sp. CA1UV-4 TaxID=3063782 RepID=UPI002712FDE2|nr:BamA/TamA family outer membrane protein [Hymenobacter sp. CA1UV-4]MDO7850327.1 BamA/TamA family outer membrane protein [Hymenobacter sp. CA1UV-4]